MADIKNESEIKKDSDAVDEGRRDFMVMTATGVACVGAAAGAIPFISSLNPSSDVLAVSSIEVDLTKIPEGKTETVMWRGFPVFIRHRSKEEITQAQAINAADLRDPQTDEERVQKGKEEWLVLIAACTHLGCIPLSNKDGWLCPCHGSHYDTSGRIVKGPAPKNLEIPQYTFLSDTKLKLG